MSFNIAEQIVPVLTALVVVSVIVICALIVTIYMNKYSGGRLHAIFEGNVRKHGSRA
jgi:hypothetical protein